MIRASAPGRVNLIGEHTDYNNGFVLPTPIPQRAYVELAMRDDDRITVTSREIGTTAMYRLGEEHELGNWIDYIQGCTLALREAGHQLRGATLHVHSDVPLRSGLSSSAALEVAVLRAFRDALSLDLDDITLALLGHRAENDIVGAPASAMDQLAASVGVPGAALLIDMQTLSTRRVRLPAADLIVISSGIQHDHAAGDFRTRRAECELAAKRLEVDTLRKLDETDLPRIERLPEPLGRRVRHVVTENARVLACVEAIERADLVQVGWLFRESHRSMRDDYQISIPAIDTLVEIANDQPAVFGARLTGGGFGGSIVALAARGSSYHVAGTIVERYRRETGKQPRVLIAGEVPCDQS